METIDDLSPSMPNPTSWPYKKWYSTDKAWYYHDTDEGTQPEYNASFYKSVDANLRVLCHFLHIKGIDTTPSCQGHFYSRTKFKDAWNLLKQEEKIIRKTGLEVSDSESEEDIIFLNPKYQLPWKNFEEFIKEAMIKQKIGYLGFIIPEKQKELAEKFMEYEVNLSYSVLEHAGKTKENGELFHILVRAPSEQQQIDEWRKLTGRILEMINGN